MLKVHKPRVYRSVQGCCICRAKSSSSRFTDSKRYEQYFKACFHILEPRQSSEICNACVLLTKRFQKLPPESTKDWRHVVDVRETNSSRTAARGAYNSDSKSKKWTRYSKHRHRSRHRDSSDRESSPSTLPLGSSASPVPPFLPPEAASVKGVTTAPGVDLLATQHPQFRPDGAGGPSSLLPSEVSDLDHEERSEGEPVEAISSFIDLSVWRRHRVCCGLLFRGPYGAVIIDQRFWRPCRNHRPAPNAVANDAVTDARSPNYASNADNDAVLLTPETSAPSSETMSPVGTYTHCG